MDNTFGEKFTLAAMKIIHEKTDDVVIPYGFNVNLEPPEYTDKYGNRGMVHVHISVPITDVMKEMNLKEEN